MTYDCAKPGGYTITNCQYFCVGLLCSRMKLLCVNCSPFYRRKTSESASQSTGALLQSAEVFEQSSRNVDGPMQAQADRHLTSTVSVGLTTEVMPAVDGNVYKHPSVSASSQTVDSNSCASSAAATPVLNNGLLPEGLNLHFCIKCIIY